MTTDTKVKLSEAKTELKATLAESAQVAKELNGLQELGWVLQTRALRLHGQIGVLEELVRNGPSANGAKALAVKKSRVAKKAAPKAAVRKPRAKKAGSGEWGSMSRVYAIAKVIENAHPGTISRQDIQAHLQDAGRKDELRDISATLSYLARTKKIESGGYGLWKHIPVE